MIKPTRNSYGYRNLLVYKKAEDLQLFLTKFVSEGPTFAAEKTLIALADQMERSARSTKQNVTEGWKRNSTNEYYQFLGYAAASNAELEADFTDIIKGIYESKGLMGVRHENGKWVEREKRDEGEEMREGGEREKWEKGAEQMGETPTPGQAGKMGIEEIEKIPFYPLNTHLPHCLQLKLRAKELNFLLDKLQKSLVQKMGSEGTLSLADKLRREKDRRAEEERWYENSLKEQGLVRLENGRVVKKGVEKG
ncbi:MAG: four helix bundle protein [Patescibacteria group bacterium]